MKYFTIYLIIFSFSFLYSGDGGAQSYKNTTSIVKSKKISAKKRVTLSKKNLCDSNYSGCVPIASDVDCAGGGGNGPAYVSGPIRVIGRDIYKLDRDKDGIACE